MATSTEGIVFQANFKTHGQTLLNIYATNGAEFGELLDVYADFIPKIVAVEQALNAASTVAHVVPVAPAAQQGGAATPPVAPPAAGPDVAADAEHLCDHGQPMKFIPPGISKSTGRPYKGFYACAQPRGMQCDKKVWLN